jgi:hypothetical protein
MQAHIRSHPAFAYLLEFQDRRMRIEDTIGRIISTDLYIPEGERSRVRKVDANDIES